ncbi:acyltransferase [Vibrio sp. SM6]|uniref:Acyltransferase n=1 Tax=Vibrio agarilyticus TaxID=2726741 RepID=A0A7X8YFN2_9VIBR|nr:acyltransferase [Vibrio agarilyticus]NLS11844.1 acyltransferase [Vibrio agarilyticus]
MNKQHIFFFDLLRCVAALAVLVIHALAPYRHELGVIPFDDWATAITLNGFSRWAVPVFIMITGALMLSDTRPFDLKYYLSRRLGKVLIPFLIWSLFYAYLSGWNAQGFNGNVVEEKLAESWQHATYYHLGFFYYFIPLYAVIPLWQWLVRHNDNNVIYALIGVWLLSTLLFLLRLDGLWSHQFWLYMGLLPLGYVLYQKWPLNPMLTRAVIFIGIAAMALSSYMVIQNSLSEARYVVGRWFSYKTLNTVLAASMVFIVCRYYADHLNNGFKKCVSFISRYSLGVYLLHPLFLWPMHAFEWYRGPVALMIPLWVFISGSLALAASYIVAQSRFTRWLLP